MSKQDNRFKTGQSGNPKGRPIGSRNKLATSFLDDMLADWQLNGKAAIAKVREEKPDQYIKIVASLLPKDINLNADPYADLSDNELIQALKEAQEGISEILSDEQLKPLKH